MPLFGCGKDEYFESPTIPNDTIEIISEETPKSDNILEFIVFNRKNGLRPVFRIPSLIVTEKGSLLISCENRSAVEDKGEIDVLLARKDTTNKIWEYQKVFCNDSTKGRVMNPIFIQDIYNKRIYLFAARLKNKDKFAAEHTSSEMDCVYKYSDDDGVSWSGEYSLKSKWDVNNYTGVIPSASNGIQDDNGTFYIPTMVVKNKSWYSGLLIKHRNKDWYFSTITPNVGDNESTVYLDLNNRIVLDCRTFNGIRNKYYYDDNKNIFVKTQDNVIESIVNLKAEITKCSLNNKSLYLMSFSNTRSNKRENLSLFASKDGINWMFICLLENGSNKFSYSNVSCYDDRIYVVYETEKNIKLKDISIYKDYIIKKLFVE